jgi:hypothetical protein
MKSNVSYILLVLVPGHNRTAVKRRGIEETHTTCKAKMSAGFVIHTVIRIDIKAKQTLSLFLPDSSFLYFET